MWHPSLNKLLWVDIEGCRIHVLDPVSGDVVDHPMPAMVSTIVPDSGDSIVVTLKGSVAHYNLSSRKLTRLASVEPHLPNNRCNDGKCDPAGRLWFGTMSLNVDEGAGTLYSFEDGKAIEPKLTHQTIPNGIVWSHDGSTMYYIDTATRCVNAYHFNKGNGDVELSRKAIKVPAEMGYPDGMAMDSEGMLWIAHWGGFGVYRWNPITGELLGIVEVPVPNVASCAFGGDDYKTLYITTARAGLSDEELVKYPLSGSLFVCSAPVAGCAAHRFAPDLSL